MVDTDPHRVTPRRVSLGEPWTRGGAVPRQVVDPDTCPMLGAGADTREAVRAGGGIGRAGDMGNPYTFPSILL